MTKKEMRQLKKEKRQRRKFDKMRRKEYTKEYRKLKDERTMVPHSYPKTRLVLVTDFLRSRDLRKAIGLFLGSQLAVFLLLMGTEFPNFAPVIGALAILIGLVCIYFSIKEINRRQSRDISRKPVDFKLVIKITFLMLLLSTAFSIIVTQIGVTQVIQDNQEKITSTIGHYPIPMIFTVLVVAPIVEELIFRELMPYAAGPSYLSFILTSLLFVVVHSPVGLIGWVTYGITTAGFLGARLINNNVYTGIWVHLIWNILSLVL